MEPFLFLLVSHGSVLAPRLCLEVVGVGVGWRGEKNPFYLTAAAGELLSALPAVCWEWEKCGKFGERNLSYSHNAPFSEGLVALPFPLLWSGGSGRGGVGADSPLVFWSLELPLVGDWGLVGLVWEAGAQPLCWGRLSWG